MYTQKPTVQQLQNMTTEMHRDYHDLTGLPEKSLKLKFTTAKGAVLRFRKDNQTGLVYDLRMCYGIKMFRRIVEGPFLEYPTLVAAGFEAGYVGGYGCWLTVTHELAHAENARIDGADAMNHGPMFQKRLNELRVLMPFEQYADRRNISDAPGDYIYRGPASNRMASRIGYDAELTSRLSDAEWAIFVEQLMKGTSLADAEKIARGELKAETFKVVPQPQAPLQRAASAAPGDAQWVSVSHACTYFGKRPQSINALAAKNKIASRQINGKRHVNLSELKIRFG